MVHGVEQFCNVYGGELVTVISLKEEVREDVLKVAEETEHDSLLACEMSKTYRPPPVALRMLACRFPMTGNNSRSAISAE